MGTMINRRRVCGGKKGLLPSGYKQLEYIESTGTQYINTGINNWNNTLEYEIKLEIRQQHNGIRTYYGAYDVWNNTGHVVPSVGTYISYRMGTSFVAGISTNAGIDIGIKIGQIGIISLKGNTLSWSVGDSTQFNRGAAFTAKVPIYLFCVNAANQAAEHSKYKMYHAKFWLDGNLVRNFIPCINPNNVVGMYDTVEGEFYSSPNGTPFIAGTEV